MLNTQIDILHVNAYILKCIIKLYDVNHMYVKGIA